jgi:N6-adenosine-specific RNA methylase IME4
MNSRKRLAVCEAVLAGELTPEEAWHKTTKHGKSHFGMGHWTRANTEDCLIAVRGKPKRVNADVRQFIEAPRGRHSAKPDEVRERLVRLMGDVPRLEMFAREAAPGWDVWGLEVESDTEVPFGGMGRLADDT